MLLYILEPSLLHFARLFRFLQLGTMQSMLKALNSG